MLIFCDGFDDGLLAQKWSVLTGGISVVTGGRNGSCLRAASGSANPNIKATKQVAAADEHATFIVTFAYRPEVIISGSASNSTYGVISLLSDSQATQHVSVGQDTDGRLTVRRGGLSGTVLGDTGVAVITANAWHSIELKAVLHDTTGSVVLKVNGLTVISLTNVDTKNGGTKTVFDSIGVGAGGGSGTDVDWDDFILCNGAGTVNNDFIGDHAIETLLPNGNGSVNQFVGSDADSVDNYLLVDEAAPSSTDYAGSGTVGQQDLYAMANLSRTAGSVAAVVSSAWAGNSDAGARSLKPLIKSGATTLAGSAQAVTTTYAPLREVYETNPNTSAAWTVSTVNAAEFGGEVA